MEAEDVVMEAVAEAVVVEDVVDLAAVDHMAVAGPTAVAVDPMEVVGDMEDQDTNCIFKMSHHCKNKIFYGRYT